MNRNLYQLIFFALLGVLATHTSQAQTSATNVRLRVDPVVKKVLIEYELPQTLPNDSIYIELETASGRILRPITVRGDVGTGIKSGTKKLIAWDVVQDNIQIDEPVTVLLRVARVIPGGSPLAMATVNPERITPRKSPLPLLGWVAAAGLTGYATVLALNLNKEVSEYNSVPTAVDAAVLSGYATKKSSIDAHKSTVTLVAGVALAAVITNVVFTIIHKRAVSPRTTLLIQPGKQLTSIGLSRRF